MQEIKRSTIRLSVEEVLQFAEAYYEGFDKTILSDEFEVKFFSISKVNKSYDIKFAFKYKNSVNARFHRYGIVIGEKNLLDYIGKSTSVYTIDKAVIRPLSHAREMEIELSPIAFENEIVITKKQ